MGLIYFIRHAESIVNVNKEFSYKLVDKGLTDKGKLQASQLADFLKNIEFHYLFVSPMKRTLETAKYISRKKSLPIEVIEEIREVNVGDLEKLSPEEMKNGWKLYFEIAQDWYKGHPERRFPNGENMQELLERFNHAVKTVLKKSKGKPAVLLGHGGIFITGLAEILTNVERKFFYENRWLNCGVASIEVDLVGDTLTAKLLNFGDVSFLSGEASQQDYPLPNFED
jgi:broad specificity phosphatase PhoE